MLTSNRLRALLQFLDASSELAFGACMLIGDKVDFELIFALFIFKFFISHAEFFIDSKETLALSPLLLDVEV